ncbi:MAG: oligosaccharide flippase family protein [Parasphingorhabdus sp.]
MSIATSLQKNAAMQSIMRGLLAYGSAELLNRLIRLVVVIVIARQLVPELVGVAALTLSLFELIRVLANIGVGQKIIATDSASLNQVCNTAYRVFWIWCGIIALMQLFVAACLYTFFDNRIAAQMLGALAGVYLFMPGGLVQCFRLMRAKKLPTVAAIGTTQTIADHLITCVLILAWASPWAIVLPKLLTAPFWLIMMRRANSWRYNSELGFAPIATMLQFGTAVLLSDIGLALRNNLDKLIIGGLLGVSALGSYYFAFNAGIGIVGALATAFGTVVYPHLCEEKPNGQQRTTLAFVVILGIALFGTLTLVQLIFAPLYVPIIFGSQWAHAIPLIQILSIAAIPMMLGALLSAYLRASGKAGIDAWIGSVICLSALGMMLAGAQFGLLPAASGWVAGTAIAIITCLIIFTGQFSLTKEFRYE